MSSLRHSALLVSLAVLGGAPQGISAQATENPKARLSRAEIETAITEAEKIVNSPGYSSRIKQTKRREIVLYRGRLADGDLQPGDRIFLSVQGEPTLTDSFAVSPNRFITLPGIADISMKGVLRSEVQDHISTELRKYLKNPVVHVRTTIRVSVLGSVGHPGYYQLPSEAMVGEAIMHAGGPAGVDPSKTRVQRSGVEIVSKEAFAEALGEGKTLDQMNLLAGDEILVGGSRVAGPSKNGLMTIVPLVTGLASLGWLVAQIF